MEPVLELKSMYKGFPYVVLFMPGSYRCGYVGIPKANRFYGKSTDDLGFVECHGGITYSEPSIYGCEETDTWWIGFDCAHCFDGYDVETAKQYFGDNPDWARIFEPMEEFYKEMNKDFEIRTLEYVKNECQNIIDQICD